MFKKIGSFFISIVMLFLSIFGISFKHNNRVINLYMSDYKITGKNEKTDELKEIFDEVIQRQPTVRIDESRKPFADDNRISAIYFDGQEYNGKASKVFAYIGFPENASSDTPVPAMVLVHGGMGHAYAQWVQYWVNNGYAAISVDGFGQHPEAGLYKGDDDLDSWSVNPDSHMTIDELQSADKPFREQWFYHYISDVILANTIISSDKKVNSDKVGITGISWGSIATSVAICYDNRFSFAIPVYGSAFLNHSTGLIGDVCRKEGYIDAWEPSHLLDTIDIPILYVNGDNDPFFSANCTTASAANAKHAAVTYVHCLAHGQNPGAYQPEVLRFANEQTGMGNGNIKIDKVSFDGNRAIVSFNAPDDVTNLKACVYYRNTELEYDGFNLKQEWKKKNGIDLDGTANIKIPKDATMFYIAVQGKIGKIFDRDTIQGTTGIYTSEIIKEKTSIQ